jgi:RNA polymerase sigma-70 factor, ECF subfamily
VGRDLPGPGEPALLERARSGSEAAYRELVEVHRAELLAHCYRILGSVLDAEDAGQDALVRAWRGLAGFEGRSSLRSWLSRSGSAMPAITGSRRCIRAASRVTDPALLEGDAGAYRSKYDWNVTVADGAFDAPYGAPTAGPPPYQPYEIRPVAVFAFVNDSALGPSSTCWRFTTRER